MTAVQCRASFVVCHTILRDVWVPTLRPDSCPSVDYSVKPTNSTVVPVAPAVSGNSHSPCLLDLASTLSFPYERLCLGRHLSPDGLDPGNSTIRGVFQ